jgi:7-cyano-7-deazaguanine synthase in queuosine biosynthesis
MKYISRLDDKEIQIDSPERDKRYAIMLSGGLDSAVLLYLLYHRGYTDLQVFTIDKADGSTTYASRVVQHFNKKFAIKLPNPVTVGDPNAHHSLQSRTALTDIFTNYEVDILFNALNKNPPELNELPSAPVRATSAPPRVALPFVDLYKTHIIDLMFELEQEDLLNVTHSCTEQPVGRCGKCWQCGERAWAFQQLGKTDTGTQ